jgi:hypothetical protein
MKHNHLKKIKILTSYTLFVGFVTYSILLILFWRGISLQTVSVGVAYQSPLPFPREFMPGDQILSLSREGKERKIFHLSTLVRLLCNNDDLSVLKVTDPSGNLKFMPLEQLPKSYVHPVSFNFMECHFPGWPRWTIPARWINPSQTTSQDLIVSKVKPDSWASRLGLKSGDTIMTINQLKPLDGMEFYNILLSEFSRGGLVNLFWSRENEGSLTNQIQLSQKDEITRFDALEFMETKFTPVFKEYRSSSLAEAISDSRIFLKDTVFILFDWRNARFIELSLQRNPSRSDQIFLALFYLGILLIPALIISILVKLGQLILSMDRKPHQIQHIET